MIRLLEDVKGEKYLKLMDYVFMRCDRFSINIPMFKNYNCNKEAQLMRIMCELRPYVIGRSISKEYFSIKSSYKREIYIFRTSKETKKIVKSVGGIYNWLYPEMPEDLCFFFSDSNKCWMETIAHEHECNIYMNTDADMAFFEKCGIGHVCDEQDKYVPSFKMNTEYITDGISSVSYEINSDWKRSNVETFSSGIKRKKYRYSIAADAVDDIVIDAVEISESGEKYIADRIKRLDDDNNVFKICQRDILVDGVSSIEYSYRYFNPENKEYTKNIEILSKLDKSTAVFFRAKILGTEGERSFREFLDSVEFCML